MLRKGTKEAKAEFKKNVIPEWLAAIDRFVCSLASIVSASTAKRPSFICHFFISLTGILLYVLLFIVPVSFLFYGVTRKNESHKGRSQLSVASDISADGRWQ